MSIRLKFSDTKIIGFLHKPHEFSLFFRSGFHKTGTQIEVKVWS